MVDIEWFVRRCVIFGWSCNANGCILNPSSLEVTSGKRVHLNKRVDDGFLTERNNLDLPSLVIDLCFWETGSLR